MKNRFIKILILLYFFIFNSFNNLAISNEFDTNLLKLKATNSCVMCNFNGVDLSEEDLSGANLSDTSFRGTDFIGSVLKNTDLK